MIVGTIVAVMTGVVGMTGAAVIMTGAAVITTVVVVAVMTAAVVTTTVVLAPDLLLDATDGTRQRDDDFVCRVQRLL
eukprot:m.21078 g.21078  ORF g.21078 m.21078 type:complete len:77 (-) comp6329_c0_seq2:444-674(-)